MLVIPVSYLDFINLKHLCLLISGVYIIATVFRVLCKQLFDFGMTIYNSMFPVSLLLQSLNVDGWVS